MDNFDIRNKILLTVKKYAETFVCHPDELDCINDDLDKIIKEVYNEGHSEGQDHILKLWKEKEEQLGACESDKKEQGSTS